jgi:glycolate oxidase
MSYKDITIEDIKVFTDIVGEDHVFTREKISDDFAHDELSGTHCFPELLVEVNETKQVSKIMRYAYENNIPVTPRGQGTGLVGAAVPIYGGLLVNMSPLNKIIELDEANMTLTVEAGTLLMEINSFLEGTGLFYAPDPGEKSATIGGNINTNAGGMRAIKYGVTRDNILGLEIVYPDGTIDNIGGKVAKTSSGYSTKDMIIGSEGTLAIVTKAILKLLPLPKYELSLLVPFPTLGKAIEAVPKVLKAKVNPMGLEFMERDVILAAEEFLGKKFPDNSADAYLLIKFNGNTKDEIEMAYEKAAFVCLDAGAIDVFISNSPEREESIWSARGAFLEAIKASTTDLDECDVVVPRDKVADFIKFTNALQEKHDVRIKSFGHAGDGNLHIYVLKDRLADKEWHDKLEDVFKDMYDRTKSIDGKVSGEHGIGYSKIPYLHQFVSKKEIEVFKGIKNVFDPKNILNPGKVI